MASGARTPEQERELYGNIREFGSQADLDHATSRAAPWGSGWEGQRGMARIGNSIYEYDNEAGWNHVRTVEPGTFPEETGDAGGILYPMPVVPGTQTPPGIFNPNPPQYQPYPMPSQAAPAPVQQPTVGMPFLPPQGAGGYGRQGVFLTPPTYTGPASYNPYVMQSSLGPGWDYQYPMIPNGM